MTQDQAGSGELADEKSADERRRLDQMFAKSYRALRRSAGHCFAGEGVQTLQPTALVNEAYLRLAAQANLSWPDKRTFLAYAARVMRQVLVDEARRRKSLKRPSSRSQTTLVEVMIAGLPAPDLLDLDDALRGLKAISERKVNIVQLRFFAGLTIPEAADCLGLSTATVNREWRAARAWLIRDLKA